MLGRNHNMIAFASLLMVAVYYPQNHLGNATVVAALVANTAGGLLPDLDQATNRLWGMLPFGNSVGRVFNHIFLNHRGLTHSLLGIFLVDKGIYWLIPKIFNISYINLSVVSVALMTGYISHLIADSITEEGLPLLFPLKYKFGFPPIKSWRIKTGHWFENFIISPIIVILIFMITFLNWNLFLKIFT